MPEYVRVKQAETGHELSVPVDHYKAVDKNAYTKVDKPAAYPDGSPVELKPKTTVAKSAAGKQAAKPANTDEGEK